MILEFVSCLGQNTNFCAYLVKIHEVSAGRVRGLTPDRVAIIFSHFSTFSRRSWRGADHDPDILVESGSDFSIRSDPDPDFIVMVGQNSDF